MADDNLRNLFDRTSRSVPATQIERRVQKLGWFIAAGYRLGEEIDSVTMLNFFSELVDEEHTMSESRFNSLWSASTAMKLKESRTNRGLITSDAPVYRACKAGKKCLRFEKRKPAPAKGNGEYCGPPCGASDRARAKRGLVMTSASEASTPTVQ